ncbi:MAG: prolipoprotein diacylglyceryl transferase [Spirochaetales bacterium]|nr:prolipoprotein diacylglyceryl transferase [Spirochaetales bacterium]
MLAYLNYPGWLKPEIIPGLPVRWYGLMYLVAFAIAYFLFEYQRKRGALEASDDDVASFFFWGILGLLLGARLFAVTVYDPTGYYIRHPWFIFWPFNASGQFVGLQGMSYHGGVVGCIAGTFLYCRKKKFSWFQWADVVVAGLPLGYTFGRLGNFINGELWGRITTAGHGMVFPHAPAFPLKFDWVRGFAAEAGMEISKTARFVNLPRHPSQLYEAFFEGIVLWAVLWFVFRLRKKFHGTLASFYLIGYGIVRFFIEYTREPDADIGFPIELVDTGGEIYRFTSFFNFSTGQILCFLMILSGSLLYFILSKKGKRL